MIFLHDNFTKDNGKWDDSIGDGNITFEHGRKKYVKTATGWNSLGSVLKLENVRILKAGDTFKLKFIPTTYTAGGTPQQANSTFWQFGLLLDTNTPLRATGYGLYLEGDAFKVQNGGTFGSLPVQVGEQYTLVLTVQADSSLAAYLGTAGNVIPLWTAPGPFLNRQAWLYFDLYSVDTVELIDLIAHDIEGI